MSYGFPPPAQAPWGPPQPPAPPAGGGMKRFVVGCLLFIVIGIAVTCGAVMYGARSLAGQEIASANVAQGMPFNIAFQQHGSDGVWLAIDASNPQGVQVNGLIVVTRGGTPLGTYQLGANLLSSCRSPVAGDTSSACMNWNYNSFSGSVSGRTRMFTIPAGPPGSVVSITGTMFLSPGTSVRDLRVLVRE